MTKTILTAACAAAVLTLAACGDDKKKDDTAASAAPATLAVSATEGTGGKAVLNVPADVNAGVVNVSFDNKSKMPRGAQIFRIDGGHTGAEALKITSTEKAKIPDWLHANGGLGTTPPGQKAQATIQIAPGSYALLDDEGDSPKTHTAKEFKVTGTGGGSLPSTDASVTVVKKGKEFAYEVKGLKAGANTITFDNKTKELHHVIAAPIKGNATIADVKKALQSQKGPPPIDFMGSSTTSVIDSKQKEVATLNLAKPGRYAFICFLTDRDGKGKPHFLEGLTKEVTIK